MLSSNVAESSCVYCVVHVAQREVIESSKLESVLAEREPCSHVLDCEQRIRLLERENALLVDQLKRAAEDRRALENRLKEALAARRSMRQDAPGQQTMAFQAPEPLPIPPFVHEAPDGEGADDQIRPRHRRKNAPRQIAYDLLPREHVRHEPAPEERVCALTGKSKVEVGERVEVRIEHRPAQLVLEVHHYPQYDLPKDEAGDRTVEPVSAPSVPSPIEDARVGPGLRA